MRGMAAAALALIVFVPSEVSACSCMSPCSIAMTWPTPAVFQGRVTRTALVRSLPASSSEVNPFDESVEVEFEVSLVWRGDVSRTTVVYTGQGGGDCGYDFDVGWGYLVTAVESGDRLTTSSCFDVVPLEEARETIAALGPGRSPEPDAAEPSPRSWGRPRATFAIGAMLLGLVLAARVTKTARYGRSRGGGP